MLDAPALRGRPIAVEQGNSGGFVAVSYEAAAAGVRKGDGVGAGGRANIQVLQDMGAIPMSHCARHALRSIPCAHTRWQKLLSTLLHPANAFMEGCSSARCPHAQSLTAWDVAGAVSREEARAKCPGLVILPMHTERYRQVGAQLHTALRDAAPGCAVEKASCDDFYLDVTGLCAADSGGNKTTGAAQNGGTSQCAVASVHIACAPGGSGTAAATGQCAKGMCLSVRELESRVSVDLQRATALAARLQRHVQATLGLTVSIGVGRTRLLARLLSPLRRPCGLTVLRDDDIASFMGAQPLRSMPKLRGKDGERVSSTLKATHVRDLAQYTEAQLRAMEPRLGAYLAALPHGGCDEDIKEAGPQKSILQERSFPALRSKAAVQDAAMPLAEGLWLRLVRSLWALAALPIAVFSAKSYWIVFHEGVSSSRTINLCANVLNLGMHSVDALQVEDTEQHSRLPSKLALQWRHQHDAARSKSVSFPARAVSALEARLRPAVVELSASQETASNEAQSQAERAAVDALAAAAVSQACS